MNKVVLSIGSNFGDKYRAVADANEWLSGLLDEVRSSSIYETPDCSGKSTKYKNSVIFGSTSLEYEYLNSKLKEYEISQGRTETMRCLNQVPVDIDIVIWNGEIRRLRDYDCEFFQIGYRELQK